MKKELLELRECMAKNGVDIYLVPTGDFHGSEYIHEYFKTREFVSGFTGSAGTLVVLQDEAALWTDGRYFLQAGAQLEGSGIDLMKDKEPGVPSILEYLKSKLELLSASGETSACGDNPVLGFDGRTIPFESAHSYVELVEEFNGSIKADIDLVGDVWKDRPILSGNKIWEMPLSSAGLPYEVKIAQVRELMEKAGASYHLISTLDDNAWLFNLRGSDVSRTPVFFSYTLITPEDVMLYVFDGALDEELIPEGVTLMPYFRRSDDGQKADFLSVLDELATIPDGESILVSPASVPFSIIDAIPAAVNVIEIDFIPSTRLKACKNPTEIEATRAAHIYDGSALTSFIYWVKTTVASGASETEISASDHLEELRRALPDFVDLSFDTIAGYADHGAIVHYSATPETDAVLRPEGFFLVDSGGQYMTGTTDTTRTVALGPLTDKMKECYTAVLKGHAQLAMACFPDGTTGKELDPIAKAPLEAYGISYNHGTGHGVGHLLCVHEGPNRINTICEEPIVPGMITSNEPGYYLEGEFGVRIENEVLCVVKDGTWYEFENLTCCPYERDAIVKEMLTDDEIAFINDYHSWVYESLSPIVTPDVAAWLQGVCAPL